jgi:hypothetical protein
MPIYEPDADENHGMPLTDTIRTVGEVFTMNKCFLHIHAKEYRSDILNVMVYDEDADRFKPITPAMIVEHCGRWDEHGRLNAIHDDLAMVSLLHLFLLSAKD